MWKTCIKKNNIQPCRLINNLFTCNDNLYSYFKAQAKTILNIKKTKRYNNLLLLYTDLITIINNVLNSLYTIKQRPINEYRNKQR